MEFWYAISVSASVIAVAAIGLFLQIRSGQLNVGMAVFVGCGGYASGVLSTVYGLSPWLAVPGAVALGFVFGALFSALTLRLHHWFFAVTTLSLSIAAVTSVGRLPLLGGPLGLAGIPLISSPYPIFAILIAAFAIAYLLDRSAIGVQVRGMGDDQTLAEIFGTKVRRLRIFIFGVGSAMGAASGALTAHRFGVYQPADLGFEASLLLFVYIIVGGKRSPYGPLVGVASLYILPEAVNILPQARFIIFGMLMMLCAALMPEGIVGAGQLLLARLRLAVGGPKPAEGRAP